jgi:hypothetical protein
LAANDSSMRSSMWLRGAGQAGHVLDAAGGHPGGQVALADVLGGVDHGVERAGHQPADHGDGDADQHRGHGPGEQQHADDGPHRLLPVVERAGDDHEAAVVELGDGGPVDDRAVGAGQVEGVTGLAPQGGDRPGGGGERRVGVVGRARRDREHLAVGADHGDPVGLVADGAGGVLGDPLELLGVDDLQGGGQPGGLRPQLLVDLGGEAALDLGDGEEPDGEGHEEDRDDDPAGDAPPGGEAGDVGTAHQVSSRRA